MTTRYRVVAEKLIDVEGEKWKLSTSEGPAIQKCPGENLLEHPCPMQALL